jgi:hypothetical protein
MAQIANQSGGMFLGIYLREPLRLGRTSFMTLGAKHGRIRLGRYDGEVLGVLGLRAMASLAGDSGMFAFGLLREDIDVTGFAGLVPGVDNGQRRNLRNGVAAVMPIFPKAVRDEEDSKAEKRQSARYKQGCDAEQMFGVLHDLNKAISAPVVAAQRDPVFSTNPFQSPSREGVGLAPLREITQPVFDTDALTHHLHVNAGLPANLCPIEGRIHSEPPQAANLSAELPRKVLASKRASPCR